MVGQEVLGQGMEGLMEWEGRVCSSWISFLVGTGRSVADGFFFMGKVAGDSARDFSHILLIEVNFFFEATYSGSSSSIMTNPLPVSPPRPTFLYQIGLFCCLTEPSRCSTVSARAHSTGHCERLICSHIHRSPKSVVLSMLIKPHL